MPLQLCVWATESEHALFFPDARMGLKRYLAFNTTWHRLHIHSQAQENTQNYMYIICSRHGKGSKQALLGT